MVNKVNSSKLCNVANLKGLKVWLCWLEASNAPNCYLEGTVVIFLSTTWSGPFVVMSLAFFF